MNVRVSVYFSGYFSVGCVVNCVGTLNRKALGLFVVALAGIAGCAHGPFGFNRNAGYEAYLGRRLLDKKLYSDGRAILQVKALPADHEFSLEQEKLFPGQSVQLDAGKKQFIIALTQLGRDPFISSKMKFEYDGATASWIKEFQDQTLIESQFPFAFPFHRVFLVSFAPNDKSSVGGPHQLRILSSVGPVEFTIEDLR